jgi:hypothetical protein
MPYAENTSVPVDRSRAEIEKILTRYGATHFMYGYNEDEAVVMFIVPIEENAARQVRFKIGMPDKNDPRFTRTPSGRRSRSPDQMLAEYEKAGRQRWRALALVIKAKLEAVESGITEFEEEFMAHIVLPDGTTVGDFVRPKIATAYASGKMPQLALPQGS